MKATDGELTLLDPMFSARIPRTAFFADNYADWFNVPPHGLSDDHVVATLASLVERGLVTSGREGRWFALSPEGGAVWEAHRRPDWSRYCVVSTAPMPGELTSLQVVAVRQDVGERCLKLALDCGLYREPQPALPTWSPAASPIYWKPDLSAWATECCVREDHSSPAAVTRFARDRTWWSDIADFLAPTS